MRANKNVEVMNNDIKCFISLYNHHPPPPTPPLNKGESFIESQFKWLPKTLPLCVNSDPFL